MVCSSSHSHFVAGESQILLKYFCWLKSTVDETKPRNGRKCLLGVYRFTQFIHLWNGRTGSIKPAYCNGQSLQRSPEVALLQSRVWFKRRGGKKSHENSSSQETQYGSLTVNNQQGDRRTHLLALGFIEGCQHSPDHLCGTVLRPLHFRVQFYYVLGSIHCHIILVVCQRGEHIL